MSADAAGLTVSISQLKEYLICPRRYQLHRVLGVAPAFVPLPLALGSAAHAGIAAIYLSFLERGVGADLDEVLQVFRDAWAVAIRGPVPVQIEDDAADPVDVGVRMLEALHRDVVAADAVDVVAVEMPFSGIELHDPDTGEVLDEKLNGAIDLVVQEGARTVIVEHKTGARKWSRDQLDQDFQVTGYQIASRSLGMGQEVGLRYQIVTKSKLTAVQIEDVVRDASAEVDFLRTASGVLRAIGSSAFWPVRSWACKTCPYAHACASTRGAR